jgi:hypothetical protein
MILRMPCRLMGALAVLAVGAAACGGGGDDGDRSRAATPTPSASASPEPESSAPDPADVRVVRAWADTLRAGRVRAAARYFALPSLVSNGTPPIKLETRAEAEFFNRTLPCGAELIDTEPAPHGFFIATFRLTERPGPGECGSGTGETARTAFRVRDDRITDWLRVRDIESAPETLS